VYIDILIFAGIAAFLVFKLMNVLGTRHGDERSRQNPFAPQQSREDKPGNGVVVDIKSARGLAPAALPAGIDSLISAEANKDGRVETGLLEIATTDARFDVNSFMQGARAAFEMIVTAYARGDVESLRMLLSPKLFNDFSAGIKARAAAGHSMEITVHRIKAARITEAHLGGTMAYITVDFDVEETSTTRDSQGNIVDGSPDRIFSVQDIWTFTRDVRAADPNWTLIETRAAEK
jgi:predicted lipid-binding transport protein (Tim44 family)